MERDTRLVYPPQKTYSNLNAACYSINCALMADSSILIARAKPSIYDRLLRSPFNCCVLLIRILKNKQKPLELSDFCLYLSLDSDFHHITNYGFMSVYNTVCPLKRNIFHNSYGVVVRKATPNC